ncbi:MAG TPA: amidohydrolase family protein [Haliangium sp.]|nr:amidohydrolase family protein [Haliangium sp.]
MTATPSFDTVIAGGLVFDGKGNAPITADVGVRGERVTAIGRDLPRDPSTRVLDARGRWVVPGFIDLHTHYDAELEIAPALSESVRHGVTAVMLGSCSLSLAVGTPDDLCDMYCRVEGMPDELVRPVMHARKTWDGHRDYFQHLSEMSLGPHVCSFVGHSAIRAHVMGISRALDRRVRPDARELAAMEALVHEGLDEGYVGLSIQTLPWDKMGGDKDYRSQPLPSTFARWSEHRRLLREVRERGRVFQGVPNVSTKWNVLLFMLESLPLLRKRLKTTVISMMDLRGQRGLHRLTGVLSRLVNRVLGGDFRWQALPEPFDLWADGIDLVVFEEFGAGAAALHLRDQAARARLFADPKYRAWFRRQWTSKLLPKVFHRQLAWAEILACPDHALVGRTFADVAAERGTSEVDAFLDLVSQYGQGLRWYTVMANDRARPLAWIMSHPDVLIGFSDAGAHLRQMAHYNFPLRMLYRVREAERAGRPFMSMERAVWRLTGEIADWLGLDVGTIETGKRADLVVIDPEGLGEAVEQVQEDVIAGLGDYVRLVRRNDQAVDAVLINGRLAVERGVPRPELGRERGFGTVLRARA